MIHRQAEDQAAQLLQFFPAVGIIGPRQVGKTTLAKKLAGRYPNSIYLDLESPQDLNKLENPETFFREFEDRLIILDEIQFASHLFPILRSVIDRNRKPGRFLLLGSASPVIMRDTSESLAGRIAYLEIGGINVSESNAINELWLRGGFPDPFLNPAINDQWKTSFIKTYQERDLPLMGLTADPLWSRRFWSMLAHSHGQITNFSELAKSLEVDRKTIKRHIDFLDHAFLLTQLPPYYYNIKKRLVKSSKLYYRDSGIVHHLFSIHSMEQLLGYPKMGSTWEGFIIEQIRQLKPQQYNLFFYRTHDGSELDLVIEKNGFPVAGIEIKYGDKISLSRGNTTAAEDLKVASRFIIKNNPDDYEFKNGFRVVGIQNFIEDHLPNL